MDSRFRGNDELGLASAVTKTFFQFYQRHFWRAFAHFFVDSSCAWRPSGRDVGRIGQ